MAVGVTRMNEAAKRHHIMRRKEGLGLDTMKLQNLAVKSKRLRIKRKPRSI